MNNYPKRLIEVDLPIKRISAHARREKSIRHGHISTLHIWWARRLLAACRAVICAALWFDPADEKCPTEFRDAVREQMRKWGRDSRGLMSAESYAHFEAVQKKPAMLDDSEMLRTLLLDFIADFANWDNSTKREYLETSRALTGAAHLAAGGEKGTRPLVVDPFAGGGAIPLEALRVGADAFASDLNPVAVLLNKVVLEYIPRYGQRLADEVRKWGAWVKAEAEKELAEFYPKDPHGATPIAYLWARTIVCEGVNCGAKFPLIRQPLISRESDGRKAIIFGDAGAGNAVNIFIEDGARINDAKSTCKGFAATCPRPSCGYTTKKKNVQAQITKSRGGADDASLLAGVTSKDGGRCYRLAVDADIQALRKARKLFEKSVRENSNGFALSEPIPSKDAHRAVGSQLPLYGFRSWGDLFTSRQKVALFALQKAVKRAYVEVRKSQDEPFAKAVFTLLAFAVDKQADYSSSLCRWVYDEGFIAATLGGEKKFPMLSDFAESNPIGSGSGNWGNQIDWIAKFLEREGNTFPEAGTATQSSTDNQMLPNDAASALITDPPYYDSVPYSDLSDYFYVWLSRTLDGIEQMPQQTLTPKDLEMTVNHPRDDAQKKRYESLLTSAFGVARETVNPSGVGVVVFAHKSTAGWESLLEAIIKSGWIVTASWAIDTERTARMNALGTASLGSSVHIVCRPRENADGSVRANDIGDWRDVLRELPVRIHEWMPRLAKEGIVGADAIFACLGPALEIFSRYSRVEKASGEQVTLRKYLEYVWAAVAKEALTMIFAGATDAIVTGFEPDARLTAMWLWTLSAGVTTESDETIAEAEEEAANDDEETSGKTAKTSGFGLEYDAARKIAQGLGAHLEQLTQLVEVKGDKARLLSVAERTKHLFGKDEAETPRKNAKKKDKQAKLFDTLEDVEADTGGWGEKSAPKLGDTVLDQVHQSMILFAAGRGDAMKRFLVDDGVGNDERFWRLANALSALYPTNGDEKRWVDGVLARKKGLGF